MIDIDNCQTIEVNELILDRIRNIFEVSIRYGFFEIVKNNIEIYYSEDNQMVSYNLQVPKAKFLEYPFFQMKLNESAFTTNQDLEITNIRSYSYHGFHIEHKDDPKKHFIRFDFEPVKEKYAPIHINAPKQKWGDHLTYPDGTNLDISKISFQIAIKVFYRYANDKNDYPLNMETNKPYVKIFENGGSKDE
ncbi:hypothetical protein [Massilibacterium senegalense]|uniref:hypothetical protein n=1 Tax=Massilibacterium senegalense TaxID=1632858 RepID=UPI0007802102|nr:hypothetical protein [Massilibacterium senegalense]